MRDPSELSHGELAAIVRHVQEVLWWDHDEERWDPDLEWESDHIEEVAAILEGYGLKPEED